MNNDPERDVASMAGDFITRDEAIAAARRFHKLDVQSQAIEAELRKLLFQLNLCGDAIANIDEEGPRFWLSRPLADLMTSIERSMDYHLNAARRYDQIVEAYALLPVELEET